MFSKPLANPSTLDRRAASCADVCGVAVRCGGALEPEPRCSGWKNAGKSRTHIPGVFSGARARGPFSLRRGLDSVACPSQAAHHLVSTLGTKKGDPLGRPRLACYAARNLA